MLNNNEPRAFAVHFVVCHYIGVLNLVLSNSGQEDLFEFRKILLHGLQVKNKFSYISGILVLIMLENVYVLRREMQKDWLCNESIHKHC